MYIRLASAFAERQEVSTKFAVGFLHMDAKELFGQASASAQTYDSHHYQQNQVVGIWRYTIKQLEPASLDNYACSFNKWLHKIGIFF